MKKLLISILMLITAFILYMLILIHQDLQELNDTVWLMKIHRLYR